MPQEMILAADTHSGTAHHRAAAKVKDLEPIRRQSLDIINEILTGSDAEGTDIRNQLRRCLDSNRGNPERALLMHLMSMPGRTAPAVIY